MARGSHRPRISSGRDWPALSDALERAYADGYDVATDLPRLAARAPLPDRHPARELHHRLLDECPSAVTPIPPSIRAALERTPTAVPPTPAPPRPLSAPPARVPQPRR